MYKEIFSYLKNLQLETIEFIGSARSRKNTAWVKERHVHDYMELIYFLDGRVNIDVSGEVLRLTAYDMVLYPAGVPHHEMPDMQSPQEIITLALKIKSGSSLGFSFKIEDTDGVFRWLFEQIHREYATKKGYYDEVMKNYFKAMVFHLLRYYERNRIEELDILSFSLQYIHDNYYCHMDIKKLASLCHVSESYLSRVFVKKVGMRPIQYLNLLRIEIAKKMLAAEDKTIKEIALQVGFEDPLYFSRVFKKIVKITPSGFRENERTVK